MDYSFLQNGSDIRGVAMENAEGLPVTLTEEACRAIGRGFALWLCAKTGHACRIALGRDCRLSGGNMLRWLAESLSEQGMLVTDMGGETTPAMFLCCVTPGYDYDAAVMVTASHLPQERNGYKFFTRSGGLESADIREILHLAGTDAVTGLAQGSIGKDNFFPVYAEGLRRKLIDATGEALPFAGLRIAVDAGNGMGGFYATEVLAKLGADVSGSVYLDPDGSFPNHIPNPENATAMQSITEAVLRSKSDFGVIFDTDVDRAGAVLADGCELNRNRLIAAISAILLEEHPGTTIVTDSVTSAGLAEFIAARGGVHCRFKRGYRNVINEGLRLNSVGQDCQLAIETSGHAALKENYFLDDGAYLVTKLLAELVRRRRNGESFEALLSGLREPAESREFRMNITIPDFKSYGQRVLDELAAYCTGRPGWHPEKENHEGVRVNLDPGHGNGWFLLRLSLHDPLLPLNIESDSVGGARQIACELAPFLARYDSLESASLRTFAEG